METIKNFFNALRMLFSGERQRCWGYCTQTDFIPWFGGKRCPECVEKTEEDLAKSVRRSITFSGFKYTSLKPDVNIPCGRRGIEYTCRKLEESGALKRNPQTAAIAKMKWKVAQKMEYSTIDYGKTGHPLDRNRS